jgi:hypothetical protein
MLRYTNHAILSWQPLLLRMPTEHVLPATAAATTATATAILLLLLGDKCMCADTGTVKPTIMLLHDYFYE